MLKQKIKTKTTLVKVWGLVALQKFLFKHQKQESNFLMEKLDRNRLNQRINLTSPVIGQTNSKCLWTWCMETFILPFLWYFCHKCIPKSNCVEIDKSKQRYILQGNWAILKNVKVKQVRLKNCFRLKDTKDTGQLNVMCDLDWILEQGIWIILFQFSWFLPL